MDMRELKALEIAARQRIVSEGGGVYTVPSQTSAAKYRVVLHPTASCSCEDWLLRQGECKHILAARIVCERGGGEKGPEIDTNEVPKRPTYSQNWPAYDLARREEKHRFQVLLADLCAGLPEPYRGVVRGQRPHSVADKLFFVCFKVYTTLSNRRFGSDLTDAYERGYVAANPQPNKVCTILESDEITPHLCTLVARSGPMSEKPEKDDIRKPTLEVQGLGERFGKLETQVAAVLQSTTPWRSAPSIWKTSEKRRGRTCGCWTGPGQSHYPAEKFFADPLSGTSEQAKDSSGSRPLQEEDPWASTRRPRRPSLATLTPWRILASSAASATSSAISCSSPSVP